MRNGRTHVVAAFLFAAFAFSGQSAQDPYLILSAPKWTNGQFQFKLTGESNINYTIEGSSNRVTWSPLVTNSSTNSERIISVAPIGENGFYRASRAPICQVVNAFTYALGVKGEINLYGNSILIDSFNSGDTNYSNANGHYDPAKRKDGGNVVATVGIPDTVYVGNASIYGRVSVAPGGSITVGPQGSVGSLAWHNAGQTGIEAGWFTQDADAAFPDVFDAPASGAAPSGGVVNGTAYQFILNTGVYDVSSLTGGAYVAGNSILIVRAILTASSSAQIVLAPGASLKIYSYATSAQFSGNAVVNSGTAKDFQYWGMPGNDTLSLTGSMDLIGFIYAPDGSVTIHGIGGIGVNVQGFIVAKAFTASGGVSIHGDEVFWKSYKVCR